MNQSLQTFYYLWHSPGRVIDPGWWEYVGVGQWRITYEHTPLVRPALDRLLRQQLALYAKPPVLSTLACELLYRERRDPLLLALGLWAMQGGALLLLRPYRESLLTRLNRFNLIQLQALLPSGPLPYAPTPEELPDIALTLGTTWLTRTSDPALKACRLLLPPSANDKQSPSECPIPVLQKLVKWL